MRDSEIDEMLNAFLTSGALPPVLARSLTAQAKNRRDLDTPLKRKLFKVRLLAESHRSVFNEIATTLNKQFGTPKNPLDYAASNYFDTVHHLSLVRLPGCFESPYGSGSFGGSSLGGGNG